MLAIDVWDGSPSQVQIFRNNSGWQLPILMNGLAAGITQDYDCSWDYFFVIDHEGIITWRGGPEGTDHPTLAAEVEAALAAMNTSPVGDTPSAGHRLEGAYPNPFNPMTSVKFNLDRDQHVRLGVFDMNGRRVAELANQTFGAGEHSVVWQGRDESGRAVASGNYLLRMVTGSGVQTSKMMLVR